MAARRTTMDIEIQKCWKPKNGKFSIESVNEFPKIQYTVIHRQGIYHTTITIFIFTACARECSLNLLVQSNIHTIRERKGLHYHYFFFFPSNTFNYHLSACHIKVTCNNTANLPEQMDYRIFKSYSPLAFI